MPCYPRDEREEYFHTVTKLPVTPREESNRSTHYQVPDESLRIYRSFIRRATQGYCNIPTRTVSHAISASVLDKPNLSPRAFCSQRVQYLLHDPALINDTSPTRVGWPQPRLIREISWLRAAKWPRPGPICILAAPGPDLSTTSCTPSRLPQARKPTNRWTTSYSPPARFVIAARYVASNLQPRQT